MPNPLPRADDLLDSVHPPLPKADDLLDAAKPKGGVGGYIEETWKGINPISTIKGMAQMAAHPIETYKADASQRQQILDAAREAWDRGDYLTAARKGVNSMIPLVGPRTDYEGDLGASGEYARMGGAMTADAANLLGPKLVGKGIEAAKPALEKVASRVAQGGLKPRGSLFDKKRSAQALLNQDLPISEESVDTLRQRAQDTHAQVMAEIPANQVIPGSTERAVNAGQGVMDNYSFPSQSGENIPKVISARETFLDNLRSRPGTPLNAPYSGPASTVPRDMTAGEMQKFKMGTYEKIRSKTQFEPTTPGEEWDLAAARSFKDDLNQHFPNLKGLFETEGEIAQLAKEMKNRVGVEGNKNPLGYGALGATVGGGLGAALGNSALISGGLAGGAAGLAVKIAQSPYMLSKIALWLHKAGQGSVSPLVARMQALGYVNQLTRDAADYDKAQDSVNAKP